MQNRATRAWRCRWISYAAAFDAASTSCLRFISRAYASFCACASRAAFSVSWSNVSTNCAYLQTPYITL
jgi:hypothetical protein